MREKKQYEKLDILALKKYLVRWRDLYPIVIKVSFKLILLSKKLSELEEKVNI